MKPYRVRRPIWGGQCLRGFGIVLNAALALGKIYPLLVVGEAWVAATTALGSVLTALGVLLTFYGVYSSNN